MLLNFVVPRFAGVFEQSRMVMPLPTKMMLEASSFVQSYGPADHRSGRGARGGAMYAYIRTQAGRLWWDTLRLEDSSAGRCAAQGRDGPVRARHGDAGRRTACRWCSRIGIAAAILNNRKIAGVAGHVSLRA